MSVLSLNPSSKAILVKTVKNTDGTVDSYPCSFEGRKLGLTEKPLPIYRDTYTGLTYVRLVENIPSGKLPADAELAAEITALNPIHFVSPDGDVKGWFVEAPDYNAREGVETTKVAAPPLVPVPVPVAIL